MSLTRLTTLPLLLTIVLCNGLVSDALADDNTTENVISDLDYGVVLYQYYQGNHQAALTEFAIIESKREIQHQGTSPQLVKGGMSLSYGLYDQANDIFDQVLKADTSAQVQADAWFGSGKLQYIEGNWHSAQQAFEKVGDALSSHHHDDFYYFQAQLALKSQDFVQFNAFKSKIAEDKPLRSYLNHNYLLVQIANNTLSVSDLTKDGFAQDPQSIALADRSYLAMGYAFIDQGSLHAAINAFKQITLDSHLLEPALLGYGWALNNLAQYGEAKSLFGQLIERDDVNYYVQEAILADAYASELLGDFKTSSTALRQGIIKLKQQQSDLIKMAQQLQVGASCYRDIVLQQPQSDCEPQYHGSNDLALIELLSDSQFSTKRDQLQQVAQLKLLFKQQLAKLQTYQQMLTEKQLITQSRLSDIKMSDLKAKVDDLTAQRNTLAARISAAKDSNDSAFFLPQLLLAQYDKINSVMTKVQSLKLNGQDVEKAAQRLDFIKRNFDWQSDYNFSVNVNESERLLKQLDLNLAQLQTMYQQLSHHVEQVANVEEELNAVDGLSARITLQLQQSDSITDRIEQDFEQQLGAYFAQRQQELNQSIAVAKLAIVRMQDASFKQNEHLAPTGLGL